MEKEHLYIYTMITMHVSAGARRVLGTPPLRAAFLQVRGGIGRRVCTHVKKYIHTYICMRVLHGQMTRPCVHYLSCAQGSLRVKMCDPSPLLSPALAS